MKRINYQQRCISCGKVPLEKDEVAICIKLLGENTNSYYCLDCLADYFEVTSQDILDRIEEYKEEGCYLFS